MNEDDVIAAVSTSPGGAPTAVVRISGSCALEVLKKVAPGVEPPGHFRWKGAAIAFPGFSRPVECVLFFMRAPASYTTEDVVEFHVPGAPPVADAALEALLSAGARPATAGEFTRRAFLGGRIDLSQAEAVERLISAGDASEFRAASRQLAGAIGRKVEEVNQAVVETLALVEMGIDFAEQDLELATKEELKTRLNDSLKRVEMLLSSSGDRFNSSECGRIALVGGPNVGKSSLFNALAGENLALTHHSPGTTRDYLTAVVSIRGRDFLLADSAGVEESAEGFMERAVAASYSLARTADLALIVADSSKPDVEDWFENLETPKVRVYNKVDLAEPSPGAPEGVSVSAKLGTGLDELKDGIIRTFDACQRAAESSAGQVARRHAAALKDARDGLLRAREALAGELSSEFVALEVREVLDALGLVTGRTAPEDVLDSIFSSFCIGK